jgi:hypothetical protein
MSPSNASSKSLRSNYCQVSFIALCLDQMEFSKMLNLFHDCKFSKILMWNGIEKIGTN